MKHALWYSLVQGITEALPVSSSAHIYLLSCYLREHAGLMVESILHLGTGLAFVMAFPGSAWKMITGFFDILKGKFNTVQARWWWFIALGTLPVMSVGGIMHGLDLRFHNTQLMAVLCTVFGVLLWWVDRKACMRFDDREENLCGQWKKRALVLGIIQTLALFPGVSRLGACLIASRYLGYSRQESLRISVSLGMVSVAACVVLEAPKWAALTLSLPTFFEIITLSFVSCFGVLALFRACISYGSFLWIMVYRCVLGILLLMSAC